MQSAVMFMLADLGNDTVVSIAKFLPFPAFARLLRTNKGLNASVKNVLKKKTDEAFVATNEVSTKLFESIKTMPLYNRVPLFVHTIKENHNVISWNHVKGIKSFWIVSVRTFPGQPRLLLDFHLSPTPVRPFGLSMLNMRSVERTVSVVMDSETAGTLLKGGGVAYADGLVEVLLREHYLDHDTGASSAHYLHFT